MALSSLLSSAPPSPSSTNHSLKYSPSLSFYYTFLTWSGLPVLSSLTSSLNSVTTPQSPPPVLTFSWVLASDFLEDDPPRSSHQHLNFCPVKTNVYHLPKTALPAGFWTCPMPPQSCEGILEFYLCSAFRVRRSLRPRPIMSTILHDGHFLSQHHQPLSIISHPVACSSLLTGLPDSNLPCPSPHLNFLKICD